MKKRVLVLAAAAVMMMASTVFAGTWKQGANRPSDWWYDNGNGTWAANGWQWIDGKCYYFDADGWMLANTVTPDGYTVDASGAWVQNGAVQTNGAAAAAETQTQTAAPAQTQNAAPAQVSGGDLTKAATLAGTYVGTNDEGGVITMVVKANADNTVTATTTNPYATWTDTYRYAGTFERGVIWEYANEEGKDSFVALNGAIDVGVILTKQ